MCISAMSTSQERIQAVIFYELRRGMKRRQHSYSALRENTTTINTVSRLVHSDRKRKHGFRRQTSLGTPQEVEDSTVRRCQGGSGGYHSESWEKVGCTGSTVISRLQALCYRRMFNRWIPHALTDSMRFPHSICQSSLSPRRECRRSTWK